eukprot:TRINITY_DN1067_c0_g1_i1.p1 TRINITY_DN1067_c0_g1~~TRINITY_DN1067_c0_g1_i1.p1  ORF type:complete len:238 (-),score=91.80 TRINITY_DN1067_c0_g1_i1:60-773(-)
MTKWFAFCAGLDWLYGRIEADFRNLSKKIEKDVAIQKEIEAREREEKRKRVEAMKAERRRKAELEAARAEAEEGCEDEHESGGDGGDGGGTNSPRKKGGKEEIEMKPFSRPTESWKGADGNDPKEKESGVEADQRNCSDVFGMEERADDDDGVDEDVSHAKQQQNELSEDVEVDSPPSTPKGRMPPTDGILETPRTAAKAPVRLEHVFHDADEEQEDMISSSHSAIPNFVASPGETV